MDKDRQTKLIVKTKERVTINHFKKVTRYNKSACQDSTEQNAETDTIPALNGKGTHSPGFPELKSLRETTTASHPQSPGHSDNSKEFLRLHNDVEVSSSRQAQVSETDHDSVTANYDNFALNYNIDSGKAYQKELYFADSANPETSSPADTAILKTRLDEPEVRTSSRGRNRELNQKAFTALLSLLDNDLPRAADKYAVIRTKLENFFDGRGCLSSVDLADETINRVARRVDDGAIIFTGDPMTYFYGVARNLVHEYWSSRERQFLSIENLSPNEHPRVDLDGATGSEERQRIERMLQSLESCLAEMPEDHRSLLMNYYVGEKRRMIDNRRALAQRFGMSDNALRIRVHRLRLALEHQVNRRLTSIRD